MNIKEAEKRTGIASSSIRYWEERGLLSAERLDNRYREYNDDDIKHLIKIKRLREVGIPIADIKLYIDAVISYEKLLSEHQKRLESDESESKRIKELLNSMIYEKDSPVSNSTESYCEFEVIPEGPLLFGLDIGTTSISAQVISLNSKSAVHTYTINYSASISDESYPDAFASDGEKLASIAISLISSALETYKNIVSIGITGQMHGIICIGEKGEALSPLYTWQNQFGQRIIGKVSICEEIEALCGKSYPTGYGLITLYALKKLGLYPKNTVKIACIADFVMMKLCQKYIPVCHPTNAHALGFYNISERKFDTESLEKLGIYKDILPEISEDYGVFGYYRGIPVSYTVGDNQSGVFGSICETGDVLLNIGTSAQVSFICKNNGNIKSNNNAACEIRPYFGENILFSGAVLCGGRALSILASFMGEVASALGQTVPKKQIYSIINSYALKSENTLDILSEFSGTRSDPLSRGYIKNIGVQNFTLSEISGGFCRAIINECYQLYREMSEEMPKRLIISGNALRRNVALRKYAEEIFGAKVTMPSHTEEAAYGAAVYGAVSANIIEKSDAKKLIKYKNI